MLQYVLFDLDGTLTDSQEGITKCVDYALRAAGIETADLSALTPYIGPPLVEGFMENHHLTHEQAVFCRDKYRERYASTGLFENRVYPGIHAALERLKAAGLSLAVATSKPELFARRILQHFQLHTLFDEICGATIDGRISHKSEVIALALQRLGSPDHSRVLMIGDRLHDIKGAHQNNVRALGVLFGFGSREELTAAGADLLAETPAHMADIILHEIKKDR